MLSKLMKYEFKATGRFCLPLFGALLIVAIVNKLFISLRFNTPMVIGTALSVVLIIAVFVIVLILTLQRFYKNLMSNEGYLMFTLPVSPGQLIWSKLIAASVWTILSLVVVGLAISIMAVTRINLTEAFRAIGDFLREAHAAGMNVVVLIIEAILVFVTSLFSGILYFYGCMSVSLLFNKHRALFAFVAFLVFNTVGQILSSIAFTVIAASRLPEAFMALGLNTQVNLAMLGILALNIAVGAIFYILTRYMLKNKLNLE
jgi:hypothetical protein